MFYCRVCQRESSCECLRYALFQHCGKLMCQVCYTGHMRNFHQEDKCYKLTKNGSIKECPPCPGLYDRSPLEQMSIDKLTDNQILEMVRIAGLKVNK